MGHKLTTMKRQLLLYLIKLLVGLVFIVLGWIGITYFLISYGAVIPANYSETILEESRKHLGEVKKITNNDLPYGSKYSLFDLDYKYIQGNMAELDINNSRNILLGKENNLQGNYVFSVVKRANQYCVIKYNIKARINSENYILNYLDYDTFSYCIMIILFIIYVYIMTLYLVSKWKQDFYKIEQITYEIENQNLDFMYEESRIKEFRNVIKALVKMRDALKNSLYQTWKVENDKNEEIAALAHDIKIPLTVISGNTELLKCNSTDEYCISHLQSIWGAVGKMEEYINLLIKYVRADKINFDRKEHILCNKFIADIVSELKTYVSGSDEDIIFSIQEINGKVEIDYTALERAIFNIVDNAMEYNTSNSDIVFDIRKKDNILILSICNKDGEFSNSVLENGTKLFFTSNENRNSVHYGIGLAYANKVIESCSGKLELRNSKDGAVVSIKLPIFD